MIWIIGYCYTITLFVTKCNDYETVLHIGIYDRVTLSIPLAGSVNYFLLVKLKFALNNRHFPFKKNLRDCNKNIPRFFGEDIDKLLISKKNYNLLLSNLEVCIVIGMLMTG